MTKQHTGKQHGEKMDRKTFFGKAGLGAAGILAAPALTGAGAGPSKDKKATSPIPKRKLGRSGLMASTLAIGGGSRWTGTDFMPSRDREAYLAEAISAGVNYIDTALKYGNSEKLFGEILTDSERDKLILSTKTPSNTYDGVMADFKLSLRRLGRDHLDIYLVHNTAMHDSVEGNAEAFKALLELREAGDVANIGFSSHGRVSPSNVPALVKEYDLDHLILTCGYKWEDYRDVYPKVFEQGCTIAAFKLARPFGRNAPHDRVRQKFEDVMKRNATSAIISHTNATDDVTWKDVLAANLQSARDFG